MKNKKLTAAKSFLGGGSYVSPEAIVSEIHSEGVLCSSSPDATLQDWENGSIDW